MILPSETAFANDNAKHMNLPQSKPSSWWNRALIPFLICLGLGYLNFALNYSLGYKEVYQHHSRASAILLWVISGYIQVCIFIYWILIICIGPGVAPKIAPFNIYDEPPRPSLQLTPTPDIFFCDKMGYPYYDSQVDSIKLERSFYSKYVGHTVLKYDHYCVWIGATIGRNNYLYFLKFCACFLAFFVVLLVYTGVYTRASINRGGEINHNYIVLYIMGGFWVLMISALLGTHLRYVCINITTLDDLAIKQRDRYTRWKSRNNKNEKKDEGKGKGKGKGRGREGGGEDGKMSRNQGSSEPRDLRPIFECLKAKTPRMEDGRRYVNVKHGEYRLVVEFDVTKRPFDLGLKINWINLVFNGNRNKMQPRSFYTNFKFILSILQMFTPFIELIWQHLGKPKYRDIEKENNEQHQSYSVYEQYSEQLGPLFLNNVYEKINKRDCYLASYTNVKEQ
ncbi:palmitoyltransferase pfa5 [Lodderomyces elongisporus]|uniref:palmitoyltransferase pfa5 n=1 Tax=Lodderomyces elongisporus TaxID=36914 RepID=UPI002920BC01|nr:palmitoyltransferase pfa5 [Lodderomyces elongisporus]WLF80814.1 palmitoyltransferase pfa5 [Lodderomyces elongisporus]